MFHQIRPGPPNTMYVVSESMQDDQSSDALRLETPDDRKEKLTWTGQMRYTYHSKIKEQ